MADGFKGKINLIRDGMPLIFYGAILCLEYSNWASIYPFGKIHFSPSLTPALFVGNS